MIGIFGSMFPSPQVQEAVGVIEGVHRKNQTNPLLPSDQVPQTFLSPERSIDSENKENLVNPCLFNYLLLVTLLKILF